LLRAQVDLALTAPSDCQGCQKDGDRLHELQTDHMGAVNCFFLARMWKRKLLCAATNER